jgi:hypothetical protein
VWQARFGQSWDEVSIDRLKCTESSGKTTYGRECNTNLQCTATMSGQDDLTSVPERVALHAFTLNNIPMLRGRRVHGRPAS